MKSCMGGTHRLMESRRVESGWIRDPDVTTTGRNVEIGLGPDPHATRRTVRAATTGAAPTHRYGDCSFEDLDTPGSRFGIEDRLTPLTTSIVTDTSTTEPIRQFRAPRTMTPEELGDNLARLVWESFSDFIAEGGAEVPLAKLGIALDDGVPDPHTTEEALIFHMWAHTRGAQLAFVRRAPDSLVKAGLDALHSAIFDDMVQHGTPESHLPIFEQRVSTRYAEYNQAANIADETLGRAIVRHLTGRSDSGTEVTQAVAERAIAVADPLRDFLEEVELVEG